MHLRAHSWWALSRQARFLIAGGVNTLAGYAIFSTLYWLIGSHVSYLVVAVVAHFLAVTCAFTVHRTLVFDSLGPLSRSFLRYNLSQLLALGFGLCALYSLVEYVRLSPLVAQACVLAASVSLSYLLHSRFSFRNG